MGSWGPLLTKLWTNEVGANFDQIFELVTIGTKVYSHFLAQEDKCEDRTVETRGSGVESQRVGAIWEVKLSVVDRTERNAMYCECHRCFHNIELWTGGEDTFAPLWCVVTGRGIEEKGEDVHSTALPTKGIQCQSIGGSDFFLGRIWWMALRTMESTKTPRVYTP